MVLEFLNIRFIFLNVNGKDTRLCINLENNFIDYHPLLSSECDGSGIIGLAIIGLPSLILISPILLTKILITKLIEVSFGMNLHSLNLYLKIKNQLDSETRELLKTLLKKDN